MTLYNDNEPFVCRWLAQLIVGGHLPSGNVLCKPIQEVEADYVRDFAQCHWFAGIGGWPLASQPGVCPLVDGISGRMGRLRGYGNSIVPQVAAAFVKAFMNIN